MGTVSLNGVILADNSQPPHDGEKVTPHTKPTADFLFNFELLFNAYLEDIYLPISNVVLPYGNFSDAFNNALLEYLSEDFEAFQQKLASFMQGKDQSPDFMNASYEELLNTPVDESAEETTQVAQQTPTSAVQSQEVDLATTSSFGFGNSFDKQHLVNNQAQAFNTFSGTSSESGFSQFYIVNASSSTELVVPSSTTAREDPPNVELGTEFTFGNLNHLLEGINFAAILRGVELDNNLIRDGNFFIKLLNGQITHVDASGHFTYTLLSTTPIADEFKYFVHDANGGVHVGHAYISQIQDEVFYAPIKFDEDSNAISFSTIGNLLAGDAPSKGATLSVLDVFDPDLGLNGLFVPLHHSLLPITFPVGGESGATTEISVSSLGFFGLKSTVVDPLNPDGFPSNLEITYLVGNGHGNAALATATIIPEIKPIVLDLTGEGFNLISPSESKITLGELTSSHLQATVGWVGEGNGILMYDAAQTHQLSSLNQISFVSYVNGAQSDLEGLKAFDSNHDNFLDSQDNSFLNFGVLLSDGKFESLSQLGIASIALNSIPLFASDQGNNLFGLTTYQTTDGASHLAADVGLGITPDVIQNHAPAPTTAASEPVNAGINTSITVAQTSDHLTPQDPPHLA